MDVLRAGSGAASGGVQVQGHQRLPPLAERRAAAPAAEANASGAASQAKTAADPAPAPAAKEESQDSFEKAARAAEWAASEFEAIQKASELLEKDLADADADIPVDEDFLFSKK